MFNEFKVTEHVKNELFNHLKYTKCRINYFADKVLSQGTEVA